MTDQQANIVESIVAPRLNANEDELTVVDVCVTEGQQVAPGQLLFVVESTKTTADVVCESAGFVHGLLVKPDDQVDVGAAMCQIADCAAGVSEEPGEPKPAHGDNQTANETVDESDDESADEAIKNIEVIAASAPPQQDVTNEEGRTDPISSTIQPIKASTPASQVNKPSQPNQGPALATAAAKILAKQHSFDVLQLGLDRIVTERDVRTAIFGKPADAVTSTKEPVTAKETGGAKRAQTTLPFRNTTTSPPKIVIFGAGTHASALIELIMVSRPEIRIVAAVDDAPGRAGEIMGVPIVGSSQELTRLRESGVAYAGLGIGAATNPRLRGELFERLIREGFELPSFVHPRANVEPSVKMGVGNQIFAGATVGTNVVLGNNTLINCGCVISHDCEIASHVHITPGAILAGAVRVGTNSTIGMGCTVYLGTTVGENVIVGNGIHVFEDIKDGEFIRPRKTVGRAA